MAGKAGEQAWTKEPWKLIDGPQGGIANVPDAIGIDGHSRYRSGAAASVYAAGGSGEFPCAIAVAPNTYTKEDAERIVACVNALAGVADPAAFVAKYARMEAALKKIQAWAEDDFMPESNTWVGDIAREALK